MKVEVVIMSYLGILAYPEVFSSEKDAKKYIIKYLGDQGKDYIKAIESKDRTEWNRYSDKYETSDSEVHWCTTSVIKPKKKKKKKK